MSDGSLKQVLQYVENTNGGATMANFVEDHEPIGELLWDRHFKQGRHIYVDDAGHIFLTSAGQKALRDA